MVASPFPSCLPGSRRIRRNGRVGRTALALQAREKPRRQTRSLLRRSRTCAPLITVESVSAARTSLQDISAFTRVKNPSSATSASAVSPDQTTSPLTYVLTPVKSLSLVMCVAGDLPDQMSGKDTRKSTRRKRSEKPRGISSSQTKIHRLQCLHKWPWELRRKKKLPSSVSKVYS